MIRQIALRIFQGLVVGVTVSTLTFVLLMSMPGDPAVNIAMAQYGEDGLTMERVEFVRNQSGLSQSSSKLYLTWLCKTLRFDLGRSMLTGKPVVESLIFHLKHSMILAAAAIFISLFLALPIGILAGLRPGSLFDQCSAAFSSFLVSMPGFVLGACLILIFAVKFSILPAAGFHMPQNIILPSITLALGLAAVSSRVIRTSVMEVQSSFYLLFARLKGLSSFRIFRDHGLKNAAIPVITFIALQLSHVLDGVVVLENLFNWPGIGLLLLDSIRARDLTMIQGITLIIGLIYVGANLLADLICFYLDPHSTEKGEVP